MRPNRRVGVEATHFLGQLWLQQAVCAVRRGKAEIVVPRRPDGSRQIAPVLAVDGCLALVQVGMQQSRKRVAVALARLEVAAVCELIPRGISGRSSSGVQLLANPSSDMLGLAVVI